MATYVIRIEYHDGRVFYQEGIYGAVSDLNDGPRTFKTEKAAEASARRLRTFSTIKSAEVREVKLTLVDPPAWDE